ncbi:afadin/alpha actinin binding protein [Metarhizium robertsii]|uniref:NIMA interactive protein n=2 Tax=Metarhizium robertsii TaxID=568076 RepID=E9F028_METRA|nr:NIMA interactive protein [Metarhizium robertsii ARSEF 23]EFY98488.2 NIMA interactive protein [Metarhizium robertsii ARSEF 23]EXV04377.1 afadin/alpha actinin binding protein [Metarhizium robertsii]
MIDAENLRTASLYINNQLLSRGLLRDGDTIDFAGAGKCGEDGAALSGRIISILNDLIIRRDRDAEHRESLSTAMRALRAENLKLTSDTARLTEKHAEAQRKADIATATETMLKTQLKSAEANARALKEDVARMKSLVAQTRASCATEIRRRDRQIDTLKKQLGEAGRSRGSRGNPAVTVITVTGETGRERDRTTLDGSLFGRDNELQSETNTTLSNLAQHLTEENDTLLCVMQRAMAQLRDMSGCTEESKGDGEVNKRPSCEEIAAELDSIMGHMRTILTNPSFVPIEEVMVREDEINRLKTGWVKMETRWKDAVHLIDGWRKRMAANGKSVCDEELQMGLRLSPVRVNDVEETRDAVMGLSVVKEEEEEEAERFMRSPCPADRVGNRPIFEAPGEGYDRVEEDYESEMTDYEDDVPADERVATTANNGMLNGFEPEPVGQRLDESLESIPLPEPPQLSPLRNSSSAGNRGFRNSEEMQSLPSEPSGVGDETGQNRMSQPKSMRSLPVRPRSLARQSMLPSKIQRLVERPRSPSRTSLDDALLPKRDAETFQREEIEIPGEPSSAKEEPGETAICPTTSAQRRVESRVASQPILPRTAEPGPQQSPLTISNIAAKLAASEKEADAARVRAKLRAARNSTRGVSRPTIAKPTKSDIAVADVQIQASTEREVAMDGDPVKRPRSPSGETEKPEKRKRDRKVGKAASRRRSTLSPRELETLISGTAE